MLKLIPVILFFVIFQITKDAFLATSVLMAGTTLSCLFEKISTGTIPKVDLITLYAVLILGGMTLLLHDPIYVQWKPTITFGVFSIILAGNMFLNRPALSESLVGDKIVVPEQVWMKADLYILWFCCLMASTNVFVVHYFSFDAWVTFKFSTIFISMIASVTLAMFLMGHAKTIEVEKS